MWKVILYITEKGKNPVGKNTFILLHGFIKKTKGLPKKELETAKARMEDYLKRKDGQNGVGRI